MKSVELGLIDTTGNVDPKLMAATVAALNVQVSQHLPRYWSTAPAATVRLLTSSEPIQPGVWPIKLVEKLKGGVGGFHFTEHNQPVAEVAAPQKSNDWTIAASHEALEMLVDPSGNRLQVAPAIKLAGGQIQDAGGEFEYLLEICDPCEAGKFAYPIGGISVSDFITPDFYDEKKLPGARYSFVGSVTAPRQILPGGYITWMHPGSSEIRQMIWLDPDAPPKIRSVGQMSGASLRILVDGMTGGLVRTAAKWRFHLTIEPGETTQKTSFKHDHWVTYHQNGEIEIEDFDDHGRSKTHIEPVVAHKTIKRPAGTHHTVKNVRKTSLTLDKDLIDPDTVIP